MSLFDGSFSRAFVFATNSFENRIDPNSEAALIVIIPEVRLDLVFSDVKARCVGKRALKSIPDLNVHFSVVYKHEQNHTVVETLLPHFPSILNAVCVIFD